MCVLVIASGIRPDLPLIVGANRDELFGRPALAMDVLRAEWPRVLGGRDLLAGGTWLAVNEHGVVAGVTNRIRREARDPTKRSRGELPIALASHSSAAAAVHAFVECFTPSEYNPGWLAVADRQRLFTIDMTTGDRPDVVEHAAGIHVFENCAPGTESAKVTHVRSLLAGLAEVPNDAVSSCVRAALSNHEMACVHGEHGGTRWSAVVTVDGSNSAPVFGYADGPPCSTPFTDVHLWELT